MSQLVHLYDPGKCLSQKLPYLNLSVSPFHFVDMRNIDDYNLFTCSVRQRDPYNLMSCLCDSSNYIYAISSDNDFDALDLTSCTSVHKISSVPWYIFHKTDLHLAWSEPACGLCERRGQRCNLKNYTRGHQIQCIDKVKTNPRMSFIPKPSWMLSFLPGNIVLKQTLCCASVGHRRIKQATNSRRSVRFCSSCDILAALFLLYRSIRVDKENELKIEKFLQDYRALKPTRFSYYDVRRITNQFSEKLGEGGYGIVYKGKLSNLTELTVNFKVTTKLN
ncbi:UNVERIFIED_CONTAM: Rust resistance kinase Lr10 [Sesamum angustifolium]|uniref:RING-type E3 ubiquitin transferase n=1 Tax=Sesamum angustifolium TaxID=2727405 RepID=A0AAW2ITV0_9LAMI